MNGEDDDWFFEEMIEAIESSERKIDAADVSELTQDVIDEMADDLYEEIIDDFSDLQTHREQIDGFEHRLHEHWGDAFDHLERLVLWMMKIGGEINHKYRFEASQENDYVFEAIAQLHARASQIAFEIVVLIKHGFADGAFARWRSLHEIAVTASFIQQHGQDTAERFLLFENIETYYFAQIYMEHHEDLGYEPISEDMLDELQELKDELIERFGDSFDRKFRPGWALHVFDNPQGGFRRLEKETGLDHHRPFYQLASQSIHSTPKGTLNRVGILELPEGPERPPVLPAGPTNAGFYDPAVLTAVSLNQVTATFNLLKPTVSRTIEGKVITMMIDDLQSIFATKSEELMDKERDALEEWSNMDISEIARHYVGFSQLLTDEFLRTHSEFDNIEEFKEIVPLAVESIADLNSEDSELFEEFVADNTDFESVDSMAEAAFEEWVENEVDPSQFSSNGN